MDQNELAGLVEKITGAARNYVRRCFDPIAARMKIVEETIQAIPPVDQLRGEPGPPGDPGADGVDGKSIDPADVLDMVAKAVAEIPRPADGKEGPAGKDADPALVSATVAKAVADAVAALPPPKDGAKGEDGRDGRDGKDGKDCDVETLKAIIEGAVAAIPKPRDGVDGRDGKDGVGTKGDKGERGDDGAAGADGRSVTLDDVAPLVREAIAMAVADIPPARDGKDADPAAIKALVDEVVASIPVPKDGADGRDGRDADPVDIERLAADVLAKIPAPKDGRDGADGKDADPDAIRAAVAQAVSELPAPERGHQGEKGERGEQGAAGDHGEPGRDGANGKDGRDGIDGKDADPDVIRAAVSKAVAELPAPERGEKGEQGEAGDRGEKGEAGVDGRDGRDGEPGRDAAQIDILDSLDQAKRYPRGTYVSWQCGLIRSYRPTDPLGDSTELEKAGWHVIVRGLSELRVDLAEDDRTVVVTMAYTGGQATTKTLTMPALIYRGIWREDGTYRRGDSATRGGSAWVLMADQQAGKPGEENSGWQLSVKKGADGRDGHKGEKGERGAEGRAGRDLTQMLPDGTRY